MAETTFQSSPLSSIPSSNPQQPPTSSQQMSTWRPARGLPFEIQQHIRIYFEESLFTRALDFLLAIITSDISSQRKEITVPPPQYLAFAASLIIHPLGTTRTTIEEKRAEATAASRLLRLLLKTVGPVNAGFKEAFKFKKLYDSSTDDDVEGSIKHSLANEDSIWSRAEDFWAVVGWALNCSCLPDMYRSRWEHWQVWLDLMITILEADWRYNVSEQTMDQSMIWRYVGHGPSDNAQPRRIMRAIFADGDKGSLNEFREVFKRELKGPKQDSSNMMTTQEPRKREAVDIDNEVYGDYLVQDDSDESEAETRASKRTSTRTATARRITPRTSRQSLHSDFSEDAGSTSTPTERATLGPPASFSLRLRLMQMLINVSSEPTLTQSRSTNFPDPTDLFTLFVEFIKPMPLAVFQTFTSPPLNTTTTTTRLTTDAHTTLLEFLLQRLLETSSPAASSTTTTTPLKPLTQSRLETHYLPFAASKASIDANVRVSLCVEGLSRGLANTGGLRRTETLKNAVERGCERRVERVKEKKEKAREGSEEEEAWDWLGESTARLKMVMKRLRS